MALIACFFAAPAFSQTFKLDLKDLRELYDHLYVEKAVWDTVEVFDPDFILLGEHYKRPHFLKSDFGRTKTLVEFGAITNYKITLTYPRIYTLEFREDAQGEFYSFQPRDISIPGLQIGFERLDDLIERIRVQSTRDVWRKAVSASVTGQLVTAQRRRGAINVEIPLPMPRQLESIFGPGEKTHINISGREAITFAGESRRVSPYIGVEGQQKQSLFPSLDMKQELDVSLNGSIGDKVLIRVDHSSQALTDNANKIELNYQGYEDDVIKRIDLGNTNLSLPGSQLMSFSSSSAGLFGVKVLAQIGATELTVIASKQEGEVSSASFSPRGGSIGQTEEREIPDYNYIANQYFWFNHPAYQDTTQLPDQAFQIDVYRSLEKNEIQGGTGDVNYFQGRAYVDRYGTGADIDNAMARIGNREEEPAHIRQPFELLTWEVDYDFIYDLDDVNRVIGLKLRQPIPETKALAVAYRNRAGQKIGGRFDSYPGITAPNDTLALELIKPPNQREYDEFGWTWDYMMRFYYSLGMTNIDPGSLELTIEDILVPRADATTPIGSDISYLRLFGLDQYDRSGRPGYDNTVDYTEGALNLETGILQFPSLHPFAPDTLSIKDWAKAELRFSTPELYQDFVGQLDSASTLFKKYVPDVTKYHQYNIVVRAVSTSRSFRIDAFNITENSEKITLDGRTLSKGRDYDIDYETGEVELKGDALDDLTPDSKISVDYEYKPFGGGAASSLVGFSTLTQLGENARFGTTWLYESKSSAAEKPRVGEEPTRAVVGGFHANVQHQSDKLTSLVNVLPLVDTDAPSAVNFSGEIAMSFPDPNTKGEAYIDDFEGVEDSDRITSARRGWRQASPPYYIPPDSVDVEALPGSGRWGFIWYNIEPDKGLHRRDLNPTLNDRENTLITALDVEIDPNPPDTAWVGVMTGFGGGGLDLTQGQFIELWINDFKGDKFHTRGGKLHIDMGSIDEDFYEPDKNQWNDEDNNGDGWVAINEDTGLDGVYNENECPTPPCDKNIDYHGDDFKATRDNGRFSKINGNERNGLWDTEDLDGSNSLDQLNSYFSYVIDLADDSAVVDIRAEYPTYNGFNSVYHERDSWRLYRINLNDFEVIAPTGIQPRFDQIKHLRVWFDDVNAVFQQEGTQLVRRFQFADLKVVGNRWEEDGVRTLGDALIPEDSLVATSFGIGVINTKTDPASYHPPIRPREENEVFEKEQSLFIKYDSLEAQTSIRVLKRFVGRGIDMTSYRDLNFWVHADPNSFNDDVEYYFRLGTSEAYYYEIAMPINAKYFDKRTGWAHVMVKLEDFSALKLSTPDSLGFVRGSTPDLVETGRSYPIKMLQSPNLGNVRFLYAGIRNLSTIGQDFPSGEIWLNDIYLGDVRRDFGHAERLSGSVNLGGGIVSLSGSWSRTDPDFRALRARRGSGTINQAYSFSARSALEHFVPLLGFAIPVSVSYNKNESRPKYIPNSDIEISEERLADSLRTETVTRTVSTSLAKKNAKNPLLKYTIGKMSTNFSVSETVGRTPTSRDTTRSMAGKLGYSINWSGQRDIRLYKNYRFRYWINSLNFNVSASRRTTRRSRFLQGEFKQDPFLFDAKLDANGAVNYQPFRSLSTSFNMSMARDVNLRHEVLGVDIGREVGRGHSFKADYKPPPLPVIKELSPDFNYTSRYQENSSPNLRRGKDPEGTRRVDNSRATTLKMKLDVGKHFGQLFDKFGVLQDDKTPSRAGTQANAPGTPAGAVPADTAAADSVSSRSRADPLIALRKFGGILKNVRRIDINIRHMVNSSYAKVYERPSLAYQMGVAMDGGKGEDGKPFGDPDSKKSNLNISLRSGAQITDNIDLQAQYMITLVGTMTNASETESRSVSWPDFGVSWKGLEQLGFFRSLFKNAQATFSYKKSWQESGRKDLIDNKRESLTISPSLVFVWKNDVSSNLNMSYTRSINDVRGNKSETNSSQVNLDFKKELKGGSGFKLPIPFFRREVKWKQRLNTGVGISYARTGGKRYTEGSDYYTPIAATSSFGISPQMTYDFSQTLNGRIFIDYGRSYTELTGQTTTTVRVGVSAVFKF